MPIYKGSTNQGLIYYGSPNTNCLTSVPKNIKLELNNGVLTLKAGSKVYVPNGKNADGSLKFDEYITSNDIVDTDFGNASREVAFLITTSGNNAFSVWPNTIVVSGTSTPDFSGTGYWGVWYDTANNIIKIQNGTNEWKTAYGFSLPFCLVSSSSSAVTSLDQIFDWCGFIGSTQFFLPGIKGLKSNGFKADGTYNNIEIETKSVLLNQYDYTTSNQQVGFGVNGNYAYRTAYYYSQATAPAVTPYSVWHNTNDNFNYYTGADTSTGWVKEPNFDFPAITYISTDSSFKITSLTPAEVQPLQTGIPITKVYKGSVLVYEKIRNRH